MAKVLVPGIQSIIEEWQGRKGYMDVGIAHSGTMDHYAARFANLLVGNDLNEALIEITAANFVIEFEEETVIAITGADSKPKIDDTEIELWRTYRVKPGNRLNLGRIGSEVNGFRQYLAVAGGVNADEYLGSKSTAVYGGFGGIEGRALKREDIITFGKPSKSLEDLEGRTVKKELKPTYRQRWEMRAIPGPNGAPDFFTEEGMELFFTATYKAQLICDRSGIRLDGPKPIFNAERAAAGGHPSNITDHGYPGPGCLNISGDTPIILPREGPTSGGYVCALSIIYVDQWMMGQIVPGRDEVKFTYCTLDEAIELRKEQNKIFVEDSIVAL